MQKWRFATFGRVNEICSWSFLTQSVHTEQKTHREMRIPERDVTYVYRIICLLTYAYPLIFTEPEAVPLGMKLI